MIFARRAAAWRRPAAVKDRIVALSVAKPKASGNAVHIRCTMNYRQSTMDPLYKCQNKRDVSSGVLTILYIQSQD